MKSNIIDQFFIDLANGLDGWGMLIYVLVTILISAILSALIGLERYRKGENAGMRTHALLAVGCSFLMSISLWAIPMAAFDAAKFDISRIAAATVSGVGFLGAGVIIKDKFTVKGLSTATTLWICAAIGLAVGAGFVLEAIIATIVTMLVVFVRNRLIIGIDRNAPHVVVESDKDCPIIDVINSVCAKNTLNLKNVDITDINDKSIVAKAYFPYHSNKLLLDYFVIEIKKVKGIKSAYIVLNKNAGNFDQGPHES